MYRCDRYLSFRIFRRNAKSERKTCKCMISHSASGSLKKLLAHNFFCCGHASRITQLSTNVHKSVVKHNTHKIYSDFKKSLSDGIAINIAIDVRIGKWGILLLLGSSDITDQGLSFSHWKSRYRRTRIYNNENLGAKNRNHTSGQKRKWRENPSY